LFFCVERRKLIARKCKIKAEKGSEERLRPEGGRYTGTTAQFTQIA